MLLRARFYMICSTMGHIEGIPAVLHDVPHVASCQLRRGILSGNYLSSVLNVSVSIHTGCLEMKPMHEDACQ